MEISNAKFMNVLLVGGAGFIGGHTAEELSRRGHKVVVLDIVKGCLRDLNTKVEFVKCDVGTAELGLIMAGEDIDAVIYFSGISHTVSSALGEKKLALQQSYWSGLYGLSRVLDAAADVKCVQKVLIASSSLISGLLKTREVGEVSLYKNGEFEKIMADIVGAQETVVDTALSYHPYVSNKIAMELCLRDWAYLTGKKFVITRFGTTYGERMRPGVVDDIFIRRAMQGKSLKIHGDGSQWRQHIYVKEIARGVVDAIEKKEAENQVFYLVPNYAVTVKEMTETIKRYLPDTKVEFTGSRALDIKMKFIDPSDTERLLGWKNEVSYDKGLEMTINWFKEHPDWMPEEIIEDLWSIKPTGD